MDVRVGLRGGRGQDVDDGWGGVVVAVAGFWREGFCCSHFFFSLCVSKSYVSSIS